MSVYGKYTGITCGTCGRDSDCGSIWCSGGVCKTVGIVGKSHIDSASLHKLVAIFHNKGFEGGTRLEHGYYNLVTPLLQCLRLCT